ncbi:hypothetical protein U9J35_22520 [Rossellomorea aquimaris]|nr:hypothetical protein [Rossellomorea aquimaris]WRP06592.1 hypothetical protein U9J35_22520 [Rossellomorea aquimaris]
MNNLTSFVFEVGATFGLTQNQLDMLETAIEMGSTVGAIAAMVGTFGVGAIGTALIVRYAQKKMLKRMLIW